MLRPASAHQVDPIARVASWAGAAGDRRDRFSIGAVRAAFVQDAGAGGESGIDGGGLHGPPRAAVLVAVGTGADGSRLILIRRALGMRANPGEIAFPGGWIEEGETPLEAALREAEEEIALPRSAVRPLGAIEPVARTSRPEDIAPFVGEILGHPALAANEHEVDEVLVVPLADLADPDRYWEEIWEPPGSPAWRMHFFDLGDDLVWGATARIVTAFLDRVGAVATGRGSRLERTGRACDRRPGRG